MGIDTLFKAKPDSWKTDPSENYWVKGFYWTNLLGNYFIRVVKDGDRYVTDDIEIDPDTLCQRVGEKDIDGCEIWENDIVMFNDWIYTPIGKAGFSELQKRPNFGYIKMDPSRMSYCIDGIKHKETPDGGEPKRLEKHLQDIEILGNIFDISGLLEEA